MFFLIDLCPWWQHLITIHCTFTLTLSAYSLHNTSTVLVVMVKEMLLHHDFLQRVFYNEFPTFLLLFKLFQTTQLAEQQIVVHPLQYVFVTSIIQHAVKPYYCQNPSKVKNVFYVQNPWGKLQILCFCFLFACLFFCFLSKDIHKHCGHMHKFCILVVKVKDIALTSASVIGSEIQFEQ